MMRKRADGPAPRIDVLGAGVIGRIYAARLAAAGVEVRLLARGQTLRSLAGRPIRLRSGGRTLRQQVSVTESVEPGSHAVLVAVRRDQIDSALASLAAVDCGRIVTLCNYPLGLRDLRARVGSQRLIAGFPGVGGYLAPDGTVEYVQIRQQPTTLQSRDGRESAVADSLRRAGFQVATTDRMDDWLATHGVFIVAMCAALERRGYSARALADDPETLRALVHAVRGGFLGLRERGIEPTPPGLSFLFTRAPTTATVAYWRRQLRSPLGTVAFAPHARDTEIAALRGDLATLLPPGTAPALDAFLGIPPTAHPND